MEVIVASVDHIKFDIDYALEEQFGALPLPFPGMDKSTSAVCEFYTQLGDCNNGPQCPYRHVRGDRTVVCKHWLRGLCKKGDQCEFLHEYDMSKMPECYFYARFNACHNKECPFLHIDPESKIKDCPWYDRGFCRHGPQCRHRHVRRVLCCNYLAGFCPDGKTCKYMHPRFQLPAPPDQKDNTKRVLPICHYCSGVGHKASTCHKMPPDQREAAQRQEEQRLRTLGVIRPGAEGDANAPSPNQPNQPPNMLGPRMPRLMHKPLEEVTCFKCGNKGHYANKCPKGHLAFLSSHAGNHQNHPNQHNQQNQHPNQQNQHPNQQNQHPNQQNQHPNQQNQHPNQQNQHPNQQNQHPNQQNQHPNQQNQHPNQQNQHPNQQNQHPNQQSQHPNQQPNNQNQQQNHQFKKPA